MTTYIVKQTREAIIFQIGFNITSTYTLPLNHSPNSSCLLCGLFGQFGPRSGLTKYGFLKVKFAKISRRHKKCMTRWSIQNKKYVPPTPPLTSWIYMTPTTTS